MKRIIRVFVLDRFIQALLKAQQAKGMLIVCVAINSSKERLTNNLTFKKKHPRHKLVYMIINNEVNHHQF